jgi:hypothetical protein
MEFDGTFFSLKTEPRPDWALVVKIGAYVGDVQRARIGLTREHKADKPSQADDQADEGNSSPPRRRHASLRDVALFQRPIAFEFRRIHDRATLRSAT